MAECQPPGTKSQAKSPPCPTEVSEEGQHPGSSNKDENDSEGRSSRDHSGCPFQEHEPLDHLLKCLPQKAQKGIFSMDLDYTSLDVSPEYIALGTSVGIVFLYDRLAMTLQKLKTQNPPEMITCVRIRQSVDYVVAAGTSTGRLFIFQLPSLLPGRAKQLHMFSVGDMHVGRITCLEWSPNTEKIFSGDFDGNVVCTEIDYTEHQSKSFTLCQEPHPVIQLSYAHRSLLVSTTFRSAICTQNADKKMKKIGTKDRKILGDFGACFLSGSYKPEDAVLYCARPGLRLWRANIQGIVEMTYMFRDLLHGKTPAVSLLSDTVSEPQQTGIIEEFNFGKLYVLGDSKELATYSGSSLFILDPGGRKLIGWANNLGDIQNLAVNGDEIFILRRGNRRRVIRIAPKRDPITEPVKDSPESHLPGKSGKTSSSGVPPSPVHLFQHTAEMMQSGIMAALQGVTEKIQEGQQLAGSPTVPPWGLAQGPRKSTSGEDADVDSCKEASSASSVSSSMHDELGSPGSELPRKIEGLSTNRVSAELCRTNKETNPETSTQTELHRCHSPKPEIHLESDDVISVHIPHQSDCSVTQDVSCERTKHNGNSSNGHSSSGLDQGGHAAAPSRISAIDKLTATTSDSSDIVFSPKPKKQKKKKPKIHTSKRMQDDNISIDSLEAGSVASEENGTNSRSLSASPMPDLNLKQEICHDSASAVEKSGLPKSMNTKSDSKIHLNQGQSKSNDSDIALPPVHKLSDLGISEIQICPELHKGVNEPGKHKSKERPKSCESEAKTGGTCGDEVDVKTDRPQSLPPISSRSSDSSADSVLFGRKTSSPNKLEPFRPPYERSTSNHSPTELDSSIISVSSISASFHEEMNEASFESYARRNSEVETTDAGEATPQSEKRKQFYQTPDSSDDFYSKYQHSASSYSLDDNYSPTYPRSLEEALDYSGSERVESQQRSHPKGAESGRSHDLSHNSEECDAHHQFSDTWTEMLAPGNLQSMCVTNKHIWVVDKSDRLHYSTLTGPGLTWRKVDEPAQQIAVSRTGSIVWRLHHGSVYAGTKITTRAPAGLNWVMVLKEVTFIEVDDTSAWYIKSNGDVMMQKGLSRDRPSFSSLKVPSESRILLRQICCQGGVIWGVTESSELVYRVGVAPSKEEGTGWNKLQSWSQSLKVSYLSFGDEDTAWVIDNTARVWFTTGISKNQPTGSNKWWEVSISEYIMNDNPTTMTMRQMAEYPLSKLVQPTAETGGLISVGQCGIWVSRSFKHVLNICRGSLLGHNWQVASPAGMAKSAQWHLVSASAATKTDGLIWSQQPNGAIFTFPPMLGKATEVSQPREDMSPFVCLSAAPECIWGLTKGGNIFIRGGMATHCLHGLSWINLDLMQLGGAQLVHLSCGSQNVWAVDISGMVYLRIGNRPPDNKHLSPAWVPVEGTTHQTGAKFSKVFTGSQDWMVWAVDNKKSVYVRKGVTDSMPIGTHWLYIPGVHAEDLALSEHLVYAINSAGELFIRYSILEENPAGDFWKRVPGAFKSISVTAGDDLWGINLEGQLCHRSTHFLKRKETEFKLTAPRSTSISDDWEVI